MSNLLTSPGVGTAAKLIKRRKSKARHKQDRADALLGRDGLSTERFRGSTELTGMPAGTSIGMGAQPDSSTGGAITPMGGGKRRRARRR